LSETLPEGWASTTLGCLSTYVTSGSRDWSQFYSNHGALFIRTQDINQNRLASADEIACVALPKQAEGKRTLVTQGDLLITITGANVGKCAHVDIPLPEAYVSQSVALVRLAKGFSGRFIQRQLISPGSDDEHTPLQQSAYGVGRPVLNLDNVRDAPIALAPFSEQERIVAKIDKLFSQVDSAREHLSRIPTILKRFRQALLSAACSGRLTEDWRSSTSQQIVPAMKSGMVSSLFDESDLPELPEKWVWTTIGALGAAEKNSITDGPFGSNLKTEHYTTSGPRVIRLQNIGDYRFVDVEAHVSEQHFDTLLKHQIRAGDVAIACLGDPVPRACLIPESVGPAIVKADCVRFKPNPDVALGNYVCYVLNDSTTRARMSEIVHGVGRARLNLQQIKSIPVPLPPMAEQLEAVNRVESMLHLAGGVERRVGLAAEQSERLAQSILAKAFRGELVPTEAELARREGREYEPASVLLERIKKEREHQTSVRPEHKKTQRRKAKLAATKG